MADIVWRVKKSDYPRVARLLWSALSAERNHDLVKLQGLQEVIRCLPGYPWHKQPDDRVVVVEE